MSRPPANRSKREAEDIDRCSLPVIENAPVAEWVDDNDEGAAAEAVEGEDEKWADDEGVDGEEEEEGADDVTPAVLDND